MLQKRRIRLSGSTWKTVSKILISKDRLPRYEDLKGHAGIKNTDSAKRVYKALMETMVRMIGRALPARSPSKPTPCTYILTPTEERRVKRWTRVYAYELPLRNRGYRAVIICSPKYKNNRWQLNDSRFAIIRDDNIAPLQTVIKKYYDSYLTIAVVSMDHTEIENELDNAGFQFCHSLEDEYWRTQHAKVRLMKKQLEMLQDEIDNSQVWPRTKRTQASPKLDTYLDYCATRFMFKQKHGTIGVSRLADDLTKTARRNLRRGSVGL